MLERKAAGEGPPSRPDIAKLQEMFPDG
ncbi:hypothetical protein [Neptunomonas marina]